MSERHDLSQCYIGVCCVCGTVLITESADAHTNEPVLCRAHAKEISADKHQRYVYCLRCRRVTYRLDTSDALARDLTRPVQLARSCPSCNPEANQIDLIPESERN